MYTEATTFFKILFFWGGGHKKYEFNLYIYVINIYMSYTMIKTNIFSFSGFSGSRRGCRRVCSNFFLLQISPFQEILRLFFLNEVFSTLAHFPPPHHPYIMYGYAEVVN